MEIQIILNKYFFYEPSWLYFHLIFVTANNLILKKADCSNPININCLNLKETKTGHGRNNRISF